MNKIVFYIIFVLVYSCKEKKNDILENFKPDYTEESILYNKISSDDESFEIDQYCERHNWPIIKSGTGVRYYIYHHGNGVKA